MTGTSVASVLAAPYRDYSNAYIAVAIAPNSSYGPVKSLYYPALSTTPFLSGSPTSTLRNNYSGFVDMEFTVGGKALSVNQLGRYVAAGNQQTHPVKLVNADGTDVAGGSVMLSLSGFSAGAYAYVTLATPVTLQANTTYYLASQEVSGGDQWYELGPLTGSGVANINRPTYSDTSGKFVLVQLTNPSASYVPVNFIYALNQ